MIFENRQEAGRRLASSLAKFKNHDDVIVLGIPRGGIPIAFEVATKLNLPLDVFVLRKLGVPGQEELAFGAIGSGGVRVLNPDIVQHCGISESGHSCSDKTRGTRTGAARGTVSRESSAAGRPWKDGHSH